MSFYKDGYEGIRTEESKKDIPLLIFQLFYIFNYISEVKTLQHDCCNWSPPVSLFHVFFFPLFLLIRILNIKTVRK